MNPKHQQFAHTRFLLERVRPDIDDALEQRSRYGDSNREFAECIAGNTALVATDDVHEALNYLCDSKPELRIAALTVISSRWPTNSGFIRECFALAFDDPKSVVRGCAWRIIAELRETDDETEVISELTADALVERFGMPRQAVTDLVSSWLDAIANFVHVGKQALRRRQRARRRETKMLCRMAGTDLDALERNPQVALDFLQHRNPQRRLAAVIVLCRDCTIDPAIADKIEEILKSETDLAVRLTALRYYVDVYAKTGDQHALRTVADIVKDHLSPSEIREIAYKGLFRISDRPVLEWPDVHEAIGKFQFPDDVDWGFVDGCQRT